MLGRLKDSDSLLSDTKDRVLSNTVMSCVSKFARNRAIPIIQPVGVEEGCCEEVALMAIHSSVAEAATLLGSPPL